MVFVEVQRTIRAAPELVFSWLADPANLTAAPLILRAGWAAGTVAAGVGAVREATATGIWLREEITDYNPPWSYSYRIVSSFPAFGHELGTMNLSAVVDGTQVDWVSRYSHPIRGGGPAMNAITSRLLPWNFNAILRRCAMDLEN